MEAALGKSGRYGSSELQKDSTAEGASRSTDGGGMSEHRGLHGTRTLACCDKPIALSSLPVGCQRDMRLGRAGLYFSCAQCSVYTGHFLTLLGDQTPTDTQDGLGTRARSSPVCDGGSWGSRWSLIWLRGSTRLDSNRHLRLTPCCSLCPPRSPLEGAFPVFVGGWGGCLQPCRPCLSRECSQLSWAGLGFVFRVA